MLCIEPMNKDHADQVIQMMAVFYASDAVSTNGSEEIFRADVENCTGDSPYLEGYVFTDGNDLAGYAMAAKSFSTEFGKPCIWIEDLYLKPQYRGQGMGATFLKYIERKYPGHLLRLEAEEENKQAVRVYEKCGFERLCYLELKKDAGI